MLVQKDEVAGPSGVGGQGRVAVVAPVTSAAAVRAASLERLLWRLWHGIRVRGGGI